MSLPRYPAYKDSGLEWLGDVPAHWQTPRLKALLQETDERSGGCEAELLGLSKMLGVVKRSELEQGAAESDDYSKYKIIHPGQLVMNKMQAWNGVFGLSPHFGIVSPDYATFRFFEPAASRYLSMMFRTDLLAGVFYTRCRGMGTAFLRINTVDFLDIKVPLPPPEEVLAIATFLDRETAKIDTLIAEQETLLALLAEKRQATISHAVTKGLNPDAPMKDSGIPWLGEVPGHWEVTPFRYCVDFMEGPGILATDFHDEGVPLLRVAGVQNHWASLEGCNYLDPEKVLVRWNHFRVQQGDLLIGASASMGTVCEVGDEVVGSIPYTGIIRLRGIKGMMIKSFVRYVVVSSQFLTQIDLLKAGATIQHFGPTHLSQMLVARPSEKEQSEISRYLEAVLSRLDSLEAAAHSAIELLKERRSALIAAAVTGQIDVRGAVGAQAA